MKSQIYIVLFLLLILLSCKSSRNTSSNAEKALYVLDGIPVSKTQTDLLKKEDLVEIIVLKGESATSLYGKKAKDGAVLITTKTAAKRIYQRNFSSVSKAYSDKIKSIGEDRDLLYVINDQPVIEHVESVLFKIKTNQVAEISILDSKETMTRFGMEKKQGSVIIKTK